MYAYIKGTNKIIKYDKCFPNFVIICPKCNHIDKLERLYLGGTYECGNCNEHFIMKEENYIQSNDLIHDLLLFKDKAFCHYSHYKAGQLWRKIRKFIPEPYNLKISIEWQHVQLGHGFKQACLALDDEIQKFLITLREKLV